MTDTTAILPLSEMKDHLRIMPEDSYFDVDLSTKMEAARTFIEGWVGPLDDFEDGVPASLKEAMKSLVGHFFQNRESVIAEPPGEVPLGFFDLIDPYRKREF